MIDFFQAVTKVVAGILISPIVIVAGWAGYSFTQQTPNQVQSFGSAQSFNPVGATSFTLSGAGVTSSQTTITLSSFKTPNGQPLIMSNFGTIGFGAIDPQTNSRLEDVSFTGVTQNANGSAVLTGVTRGLSFIYPYTASTTLQYSHAGGATFILTNTAAFYGTQFGFLQNDQTWTGLNTYTNPPIFTNVATSSSQAASIAYVNGVAIQGAATSTFTASGISTLATGAQAAAGTYKLTQPNFLSTAISTSTPFRNFNNQVPVTMTNDGLANTLNPLFIPTSSPMFWNASTTISNAFVNLGLTNATTTVSGTTTVQSLEVRGHGLLGDVSRLILATTTDTTITGNNATSTLLSVSIPPNVLFTNNTNGVIRTKINLGSGNFTRNNLPLFYLEFSYGGTIFTLATSTNTGEDTLFNNGDITFEIYGNNATNAQEMKAAMNWTNVNGTTFNYNFATSSIKNASVDSTIPQTLLIQGSISGVTASMFRVINANVFLER